MRARYLYLIALAVILLDQASKYAVIHRLPTGSSIPVLDGVIYFTSVRNPGGAFGIFQSGTMLFTVVTIGVCVAIIIIGRRGLALPAIVMATLGLLLGGAAGNLIDRIRFNSVIDFIDFRFWPVFNVADSAITAGIVLMAYYLIFCERRQTPVKSKG